MADTAKHTAGPWTVLGVDCVDGMKFVDIECGEVATKSCRSIAYVRTADGGDTVTEQDMANAHLIAAAPDLLEALKLFVRAEKMARDGNPPTGADELIELGDAAIAKAEGV